MNKIWIYFLLVANIQLFGQTITEGTAPLTKEINLSDTSLKNYDPILNSLDHQPIPASEYADKKDILYKKRLQQLQSTQSKKKSSSGEEAVSPKILKQYIANNATGSPSDNDIAVSLDETVISAVNSNINIYNSNGDSIKNITLSSLAQSLGTFTFNSDPRLLYDSENDRFIIVWFTGNLSTTNKIIVGFSKTNDPKGFWNFYKLNGNSFNDSTWSDYPIISLSKGDLFMTFNQVKDNVSWTVGFKQSVIWQIDKAKGYAGDSLKYKLWSGLQYQGRNYRNVCPAKNQTGSLDSNMYFLSVRNVDFENDTIFLLEITNTYASNKATLKQKVLKSPVKYGFPPNAWQGKVNNITQQLMTNDARVLAAIYENDYIHFGSNSVLPSNTTATVMLGSIKNVSSSNPKVWTRLLNEPNMEFGYPSMAYMAGDPLDHRVMFSFSHCITDEYAGTSVIYKNAKDSFSKLLSVRNGSDIINPYTLAKDSIERWGDYSNMQRLYQTENEVYLANSFGKENRMKTLIAKLEVTNDTVKAPKPTTTGIQLANHSESIGVFPNPIFDKQFTVDFNLNEKEYLTIALYDLQGKLVTKLLEKFGEAGRNKFSIRTNDLSQGIYNLVISGNKSTYLFRQLRME